MVGYLKTVLMTSEKKDDDDVNDDDYESEDEYCKIDYFQMNPK